jgi:hypothetical protein
MDRKAARALAKTTLDALNVFTAVLHGAPDKFGGRSPIAIISSRSLQLIDDARALYTVENGLTVSIYVVREPGEAPAAAAEDLLDDLALLTATALHMTGRFQLETSSAAPESGNLRDVDQNGKLYRVERIPLIVLDAHEDGD